MIVKKRVRFNKLSHEFSVLAAREKCARTKYLLELLNVARVLLHTLIVLGVTGLAYFRWFVQTHTHFWRS